MPNRRDFDVSMNGDQVGSYPFSGTFTTRMTAQTAQRVATDGRRHRPTGGWVEPTTYSMFERIDVRPHGYTRDDGPYGPSTVTGIINPGAFVGTFGEALSMIDCADPETFPTSVSNSALIKARNKLKNQQVNLATNYAERDQAVHLVTSNVKKLRDIVIAVADRDWRSLKRMFPNSVRKAARSTGQNWLELQYGWKPLLSDCYGAVSALDNLPFTDWMVTVKAKAQSKRGGKGTVSHALNGWQNHYHVNADLLYGSEVRIDACPTSSALHTAASLGLSNPLYLAWEELPFSFVADWFIPIGDYLNQFDSLLGWDIKGFSQSNFTKCTAIARGDSYEQIGGTAGYHSSQDWEAKYRYVSVARTGGTSVPFPTFPSFKDPTALPHLYNALALLTGALTKLKR